MGQQGFGQFSQEALEKRGNVVGMEVTGGEVDVGAAVELLSQRLLSQTVPRNTKQTLHLQIYTTTFTLHKLMLHISKRQNIVEFYS